MRPLTPLLTLLPLFFLVYQQQAQANELPSTDKLAPQTITPPQAVTPEAAKANRADELAQPQLKRVTDKGLTKPNMPTKGEAVMLQGTVRYLHMEGGFWGIVADNGQHILPKNLPQEYRKDGIRLSFSAQEITGMMTIQQWGKLSNLSDITVIGQVESQSADPRL